jgi:mannose-1-phosphate guanylyltransferase/phosphomannomutase
VKALLLADRDQGQLAPLTDHTCPAMLPIVGKPLVVHAIESLVAAGVREIVVAASDRAHQIEKELGNGSRFGATVRIVLTRGNEGFDAVAARLGSQMGNEYLAMHADVLRSSFVGRFLSLASARPERTLRATVNGQSCGLWRVQRGHEWNAQDVEVPGASALPIDSLQAFHQANISALHGEFTGLIVPGRQLPTNIIVRRQASLPWDLQHDGPVFAGQNSSVKSGCALHDGVVLSDNVVIDSKTTLRNTVILPNTYVGPMVELENAVAWKTDLMRVDTNTVVRVTDPALLADLTSQTPGAAFRRGLDRMLGVVLFLLSLPLWPVMLVDSLRVDSRSPLRRLRLLGNRTETDAEGLPQPREFDTHEAATRIPVLRHLPRVIAVITGDLSLVGVQPLTPRDSDMRTEDWERVREGAPIGLLGPAPLGTPQDATVEDKLLLEAMYAETRTGWSDLKWLGKGVLSLFTLRAWRLPIRY